MSPFGRTEGRLLALTAILLTAAGMRGATSAFSPVFDRIDDELGLGTVVLGVVGALPLVAFAASGFVAPRLARRFGLEAALVAALGVAVVGQVGRAVAQETAGIVAGTVLTMLGIGIGNVLLPPAVKRYFPDRVGLISTVYITLLGIGGALPGFLAVPLSDAIGWRVTLASWGITLALGIVPWLVLARRPQLATGPIDIIVPADAPARVHVARSPIAWGLVLVLAGSASGGYNAAAWMPTILRDLAGLDPTAAGIQVGILFAMTIPTAVIVPLFSTRTRPAVAIILLAVVLGTVGWSGLLVAPQVATTLWVVLIGLAGLTFPLVLVQLAVRSSSPQIAARLSGFVQGTAYVTTGVVVFAIGVLHTLTGSWTVPLIVLGTLAVLPLPGAFLLANSRKVG